MIDWEEIIAASSEDDLKKVKVWLFQENMRLENERRELEKTRDKFLSEKMQFCKEMNALNQRSVIERRRLKEENLFFDKKMEILKAGFAQLEADRKQLERDRKAFLEERSRRPERGMEFLTGEIAQVLFRGVNNPLALRKRYRDLVKIYHPDNAYGDEELIQLINKEFVRRKKEE